MKFIWAVGFLILLTSCDFSITTAAIGPPVESYVQDPGNIEILFCPKDRCEEKLIEFLNTAEESIHCALFDIGLPSVQEVLRKKAKQIEVQVVTDDQYIHKFSEPFVKKDRWGLQHNKFCIIDQKSVSTGSTNPTENGVSKNNNNLLIINSTILAYNYEAEFQEMWNGTFKGGKRVSNPKIKLQDIIIENYFCPEDYCALRVKNELRKAKESIFFMLFAFTHEGISNILLLKNLEGLDVRGVIEARQAGKGSQFSRLKYQGMDLVKDSSKGNLHHKVFIIDNKTVITGSFNPSQGGDTRNDENVLIIRDEEIAEKFMEEFENVSKII